MLSEAEWEYAARAGDPGKWSFGDNEDELSTYAWFVANFPNEPKPVRRKNPNAFGLYDMHGNVYEWTEDCVNSNYEGAPTDGRAWLKGNCTSRVLRGGSWFSLSNDLRSAYRTSSATVSRNYGFGFRLARTLNP